MLIVHYDESLTSTQVLFYKIYLLEQGYDMCTVQTTKIKKLEI